MGPWRVFLMTDKGGKEPLELMSLLYWQDWSYLWCTESLKVTGTKP